MNLERQFQLNESVLRNLTLKTDPRIADAMVQHALTGGPISERKPKPEAEAKASDVEVVEEGSGEVEE